MDQLLRKEEGAANDPVSKLQREIAELEVALEEVKRELRPFEQQIHARLETQINRVRELFDLYKRQKSEKKAKRLEQKKRGKNWVEPRQLRLHSPAKEAGPNISGDEAKELRRLYKEAVVHVHPDKWGHTGEADKIQQATSITAQLNSIYKRGDLEELINFYHYILGENAVADKDGGADLGTIEVRTRVAALNRKKETLMQQLAQLRGSYTYTVLQTYENPLSFIDELYVQFQERIQQLEKRTRKR